MTAEVVGSWPVPAWATASYPDETFVAHERESSRSVLARGIPPRSVRVWISQCDNLDSSDGQITVHRGEPEVGVDSLSLTMPDALILADALVEVVEAVQGPRRSASGVTSKVEEMRHVIGCLQAALLDLDGALDYGERVRQGRAILAEFAGGDR